MVLYHARNAVFGCCESSFAGGGSSSKSCSFEMSSGICICLSTDIWVNNSHAYLYRAWCALKNPTIALFPDVPTYSAYQLVCDGSFLLTRICTFSQTLNGMSQWLNICVSRPDGLCVITRQCNMLTRFLLISTQHTKFWTYPFTFLQVVLRE